MMLAAPSSLPGSERPRSPGAPSVKPLQGRDATFNDVSNFEDIGLDDSRPPLQSRDSYATRTASWNANPVPNGKPTGEQHGSKPVKQLRSITGASAERQHERRARRNDTYASVQGPGRLLAGENRRLGPAPNGRRGFTSPSAPSLQMTMFRKRSLSPNLNGDRSIPASSPTSPSKGRGSNDLTLSPFPSLQSRRRSWQPNRKTVKQLEDECRDSDDDDVPDEAVIWNVPISPRPPNERPPSASPSPSHSPDRALPRFNPSFPGPTRSFSTFVRTDDRSNPFRSVSPDKPITERGSSSSQVPRTRPNQNHKARAKSWNVALYDLSDEAKTLTEALELHADSTGRGFSSSRSKKASGATIPEKYRSKSVIVELPSLSKGNVMIDPLPISKEKEAALTKTRPSWLPPKCPKEEKKHLKEYERLVLLSQESERKRIAAEEQQAQALESQKDSLSRIWEQHVLPNWSQTIAEPRTRELWWRGIAPRSRGEVWSRAIGNELSLTTASFHTALKRARNVEKAVRENEAEGIADPRSAREGAWFTAIDRDAETAWPKTGLFGTNGPLREHLIELCMAYATYRNDVGYIYGIHLIAALLLLNMASDKAFIALANLFNRPLPLSFLTGDPNGMARAYALTLSTLEYKHPRLHEHLIKSLKLSPEILFEPTFRTLFCLGTGGAVGLEEVSRLWDIMVFEGDRTAVRGVIGVLSALEPKILGHSAKEIRDLLGWSWEGPEQLRKPEEVEQFIAVVREAGKEDRGRSPAPPQRRA